MLTGTLTMKPLPGRREEFLSIVRSTVGPARVMKGCIGCHLSTEVGEEDLITIQTQWESQADLDDYLRSQRFSEILVAMDLLKEPPEIRFDKILRSTDMEAVKKARGRQT